MALPATLSASDPPMDRLSIGALLMSADPRSTTPGVALVGVGAVLALVAFVWMSIIGYYPDQLPVILVLLAAGGVLLWLGQRMYQAAKRENALHRIKERDLGKA